jgi:hypothetical protein
MARTWGWLAAQRVRREMDSVSEGMWSKGWRPFKKEVTAEIAKNAEIVEHEEEQKEG